MDDSKSQIPLSIISVGDLKGNFRIPSYQRGYRWERHQVKQLLDDILYSYNSDRNAPYYLQPIVVAPNDLGGYDLVDGQQRLTTVYLINHYLDVVRKSWGNGTFNILRSLDTTPKYSISYQTRLDSKDFLEGIEHKKLEDAAVSPDFLYMWHSYDEIKIWFEENHSDDIGTIAKAINTQVKIIWYQINESISSWKKFADLNIGKIPLTNSELVKALFMRDSGANKITEQEKGVIVDQWDGIERELHNPLLWGFLTNKKQDDYDTLIDLIFDIIACKKEGENDDFFTFQYFEKELGGTNLSKGKGNWDNIYLQYQRLCDWYEDRDIYHKVGYLVIQEKNFLSDLFQKVKIMTLSEFNEELDTRIRNSISALKGSGDELRCLNDLTYGSDNALIERILTLFNVLTVNGFKDPTQRYSFYHHKNVRGGWSLEHIHAQKSEDLRKVEQWELWVGLHKKSLKRFRDLRVIQGADKDEIERIDKLNKEMAAYKGNSRTLEKFKYIAKEFSEITVSKEDKRTTSEYKDEMANLALLGKNTNSLLNKSVFDVKRDLILEALSENYIPVCTQRVFLKVYTKLDDNQPYFWGDLDRKAYIDAMEEILKDYLYDGYVTEKEKRANVESMENKSKEEE